MSLMIVCGCASHAVAPSPVDASIDAVVVVTDSATYDVSIAVEPDAAEPKTCTCDDDCSGPDNASCDHGLCKGHH